MRVIDLVFNAIGFLDNIRASRHDDSWNADRKRLLRARTYSLLSGLALLALYLMLPEPRFAQTAGIGAALSEGSHEAYAFFHAGLGLAVAAAFMWWLYAYWQLYRFLQDPTK